MKRLIDADDLKRALVTNGFKNDIDMMMTLETINNATTIDAVPLDGSFLKMSRGDYLIYKRHWLYEHFDMEMEIQRSAMKFMGYEPAIKDAQPHWIPCSERLPEVRQWVLCQCRAGIMDVLRLTEDGSWYKGYPNAEYMGGFVVAWMPLPKPYGGDKEE